MMKGKWPFVLFPFFFFSDSLLAMDLDLKNIVPIQSQIEGHTPPPVEIAENRYLFTRDSVELRAKVFSEKLQYKNGTENSNRTLKSNNSTEYRINWYMTSGIRWQPMLTILSKTVDYNLAQGSGITYKSDNLLGMGIGIRYRSSRRFIFSFLGEIEQYHFLEYQDLSGTKGKQLIEASPSKFTFLSEFLIWQKEKIFLKTVFGPVYNFNKSTANVRTNRGYGLTFEFLASYWFNLNNGIILGNQYRTHKQEIRNGHFQADTTRTTLGVFAEYRHTF